jgi:hypothetical protein
MVRTLGWLGRAWINLACVAIALSYVSIAIFDGLGKLWDIIDPFNFYNTIAILIAVAPGVGLLMLADRIERRRSARRLTQ